MTPTRGDHDPAALPALPALPVLPPSARAAADAGPTEPDPLPERTWVEHTMGMPFSLTVRGPLARDARAAAAVAAAVERLHWVDATFSPYRETSEVLRLRRGELTLAECHPDVREVARLCRAAREHTYGWFDAEFPDADGVRWFNPTGLVKGWAVDEACRRLAAALPGHDLLVNGSGDIAVRCQRSDTPAFRLGIENPLDRSMLVATFELRSGGIATSGTAARGTHIVVPATGARVDALASVSVIGPSLLWADVEATAAFAMGADCEDFLTRLERHVSLIVFKDGSTRAVNGPIPDAP